MLKSPKTNTADGLIERTSTVLEEIASKTVHKDKESDHRGKSSKALNKVKPARNINKNLQSFLEISAIGSPSFT